MNIKVNTVHLPKSIYVIDDKKNVMIFIFPFRKYFLLSPNSGQIGGKSVKTDVGLKSTFSAIVRLLMD